MANKKKIMPAKDELSKYYIDKHFSTEQCGKIFNVSRSTIEKWCVFYGIKKDAQQIKKDKEFNNIQKYGCLYPMQSKEIQDKLIATNLKKYGCKYSCNNEEVIKKKEQTNLKKYGSTCSLNNSEVKEKAKQTSLKNYGFTSPMKSKKVQEKAKQTCLKKYGVEYANQAESTKQKIKETTFKHYGVTCNLCDPETQQRIRATNLKKYGTENFKQKDIKHLDIWNDNVLFSKYVKNSNNKKTVEEIRKYFNLLDHTSVYDKIHKLQLDEYIDFNPSHSQYEDEICDILKQWGIKNIQRNVRILEGLEIDLYMPDYNIGIEFNGEYWHSDVQPKMQDYNGRTRYHQKKSLLAESKGIFLFHIFEHEWSDNYINANHQFKNSKDNIKNRLYNLFNLNEKDKIPGRLCSIAEVSPFDKKIFLNENHIQRNDQSLYNIGLYHNNELVSCMTFKKSKYKKYTWELSRFCTKHNTIVQGGASKLFKYFIENKLKDKESVVSYNDITKTKGTLYQILGFECTNISAPNYWWVNFGNLNIRTRYQEQTAGEVDRMHAQGYHRVCDCGTKTWIYIK